ncbi:MAG: hypothetical protein IPL49_21085 [Saprospirales bacterium]|nr:hypothetical protein [Saprospirales bacterium]
MKPSVEVTNVGQNQVDCEVRARIVPAGQESLLASGWEAGVPPGCWSGVATLPKLQPAHTVEATFGHFQFIPGQWYTLQYWVQAEGDQVARNDTTSVRFQYAPEQYFMSDPGLKVTVVGTGRTTGHVLTLTAYNPTEENQRFKVGPAITRVVGEYQDYIIVDLVDVELAPNKRWSFLWTDIASTSDGLHCPKGQPVRTLPPGSLRTIWGHFCVQAICLHPVQDSSL